MLKLPLPVFNTPDPPAPPPVTPPAPDPNVPPVVPPVAPPVVPPVAPPVVPPVVPPAPDPNAPPAITLPPEGAPKDAWDAFYKAAGRPDAPTDYKFEFKEGTTVDEGFKTWAGDTFHGLGLTSAQATGLVSKWQEFVETHGAQMSEAAKTADTAAIATLKTELGGDEKFNAFVADGQKAFKGLDLPAATMSALEGAAGTHAYLSLMAALGKKMGGEGGFISTGGGGDMAPAQMTKEQATAEINKLNGDVEFNKKYLDANHPEHKTATDKMQALFARAYAPT